MKKIFIIPVICVFIFLIGALSVYLIKGKFLVSPVKNSPHLIQEKPLEKYSFERLKFRQPTAGKITLDEILQDKPQFISYQFFFSTNEKKVSGLANIPKKAGIYPVIVMLRGYVDKTIYETGTGTSRAGEVFAQNGYLTLAPDFLGYGESSSPSADSIEERFETYTTVLDLLSSLKSLPLSLMEKNIDEVKVDTDRVGIWAHSNGGQIALSILEITAGSFPTVLWAPVSKPFPYSILYFTDEFEDHGKALRKVVADFEKDYDIEKYSPTNYFDWINAPIQLHQGGEDEAVPERWSDELYKTLKKLDKDITYFTYPGANHNLTPGWNQAVGRSLEFYRLQLK